MALNVQTSYSYSENNASITGSATKSVTITGAAAVKNIQNIGTSWEALDLGEVTTPGITAGKNLDATNYVELSFDGGTTAHLKAKAGEPFLFRPTGTTIHARANTAAVNLEYFIASD